MFERAAVFSALLVLVLFTVAGLNYHQHLENIGATQVVKEAN